MKHMLMLYADTREGAKIPPDEMAKWMDKMGAFKGALEKAGSMSPMAGLPPSGKQPPSISRTAR